MHANSEKPRLVIVVSWREGDGDLEGLAPMQPKLVKEVSERLGIVTDSECMT